eukprot:12573039-Alexandrium_andersonii.AAC.1
MQYQRPSRRQSWPSSRTSALAWSASLLFRWPSRRPAAPAPRCEAGCEGARRCLGAALAQ